MSKYYGAIGFASVVEDPIGVYSEKIVERKYYGDVVRVARRLQSSDTINDNITVSNQIKIVADNFAEQNIFAMRYVEWAGVKWKITSVEVRKPRISLFIGGIYNESEQN